MRNRVRTAKTLVLGASLLALAACGGQGGDGNDGKGSEEAKEAALPAGPGRQPQAVSVAAVELQNFAPRLVVAGQVQPVAQARVFPTQSGAQVIRLLVDAGDRVRAGQPMAVLDSQQVEADAELLDAQVRRARTALAEAQTAVAAARQNLSLQQAEIALAQAEAEYQRALATSADGALSQEQIEARKTARDLAAARFSNQRGDIRALLDARRQQLEQAEARAAAATADLQVAEAQRRQSNVRQNSGVVSAPVSGLVTQRNVTVGEIAGAGGQPMFVITANDALEVAAEVPEVDIPRLTPGMEAVFRAPDGTNVFGVLRRMPAQIDSQRRTGIARFSLEPAPGVRAGVFLTGEATSANRSVLAVPASALIFDREGASVFVLGARNAVQKVRVTAGQRQGTFVELIDGPQAGAMVVTAGASFLAEGEVIAPKREVPGDGPRTAPAQAAPAPSKATPAPAAPPQR
jgi:HlyD family secretion protein